jgi:hypothetical protein
MNDSGKGFLLFVISIDTCSIHYNDKQEFLLVTIINVNNDVGGTFSITIKSNFTSYEATDADQPPCASPAKNHFLTVMNFRTVKNAVEKPFSLWKARSSRQIITNMMCRVTFLGSSFRHEVFRMITSKIHTGHYSKKTTTFFLYLDTWSVIRSEFFPFFGSQMYNWIVHLAFCVESYRKSHLYTWIVQLAFISIHYLKIIIEVSLKINNYGISELLLIGSWIGIIWYSIEKVPVSNKMACWIKLYFDVFLNREPFEMFPRFCSVISQFTSRPFAQGKVETSNRTTVSFGNICLRNGTCFLA